MRKAIRTGMLCAALFALFTLGGCDVEEMSTLPDLSRPYAGFYECEKLLLGGEDVSKEFEYLRLELGYGGEFTFTYRGTDGNEGTYRGKYRVDMQKGEISFTSGHGLKSSAFTFPMRDGCVFIDLTFGGKLLHAEFSFP